MPVITKDNCNSGNQDLFELHQSLSESNATYIWKAQAIHLIQTTQIKYSFSQTVLSQCKLVEGTFWRFYYFLSPQKFNLKDGNAELFDIEKTIGVASDFTFIKSKHTEIERIAKMRYKLDLAQQEYKASQIASYLAMDPPVADETTKAVYLIMNKMPGRSLINIIDDDSNEKRILSWEERLNLIRASLQALKEQLTDKNWVHGDVKPHNMIVQSVSAQFLEKTAVKFIDYEGSYPISNDLKTPTATMRTIGYEAPEHLTSMPIKPSSKSDVFSIGRVILLLLGFNDSTDLHDYWGETASRATDCLAYFKSDLASNIDRKYNYDYKQSLTPDEEHVLIALLQDMLTLDPEQRITLDEAMKRFDKFSAAYIRVLPEALSAKMPKGTRQHHFGLFKHTLQQQSNIEHSEQRVFKITTV